MNIKKISVSILSTTILFSGIVSAGSGDYFPSDQSGLRTNGITKASHNNGTGGSEQFNLFRDSDLLAWLRWHDNNPAYMDERDFTSVTKIDSEGKAKFYEHGISNLNQGDKIRVMVYAHNNAKQICGGGNYARNVQVGVDFTDHTRPLGYINSSNSVPGLINDPIDLSFSNTNSTLKPINTPYIVERESADAVPHCGNPLNLNLKRSSIPNQTKTSTKFYSDLGNIAGSFGNFKAVYFDFEVVPTVCGDGTKEGPEMCDDSNTTDGDGCSATCQIETPSCGSAVFTDKDIAPVEFQWSATGANQYNLQCNGIKSVTAHAVGNFGSEEILNTIPTEKGFETCTVTATNTYANPNTTAQCGDTINYEKKCPDGQFPNPTTGQCENIVDINKTVSNLTNPGANPAPGDELEYAITITNNTNDNISRVGVTDSLKDKPVTYKRTNYDQVSLDNDVVYMGFKVPAKSTLTKSFIVEVLPSTTGEVCNIAKVYGIDNINNIGQESNNACVQVVELCPDGQFPDPITGQCKNIVDINKTVSNLTNPGANPAPGDELEYAITITNNTNDNISRVGVTDSLKDKPVTYKRTNYDQVSLDNDVVYMGFKVPAKSTLTKSFIVEVLPSTTDEVCNIAKVYGIDNINNIGQESNESCIKIEDPSSTPSILIQKDDSLFGAADPDYTNHPEGHQVVGEGQTATFTVKVTNTGDESLDTLVISDSESEFCALTEDETQYILNGWKNALVAFGGWFGGAAANTPVLPKDIQFDPSNQGIDDNGQLDPGEWFTYQCQQPNVKKSTFIDHSRPTNGLNPDLDPGEDGLDGIKDNNISITANSTVDDAPVDSSDYTNITVNTDTDGDFEITKTSSPLYIGAGNGEVNKGQIIEYTIRITNTSNNETLTNFVVTDDLDPLVDFVSNRNDTSITNTTDELGNEQVQINIDSLKPGEFSDKTFDVVLHADAPVDERLCNFAVVTQDHRQKESDEICHKVVDNSGGPNIDVVKSSDPEFGPVPVGQSIEFTFEVTNTSGKTARDVMVFDALEDHLQFNANLTTDSGINVKTIDGVERVELDFGKIAAGENATKSFFVDVIAVPTNENVTCNRGQGYIDDQHEDSSNLLCLDINPDTVPSILIEKDDSTFGTDDSDVGHDNQIIPANGTATFTVKVTNNGSENLDTLIIEDPESPQCALTENQTEDILSGNEAPDHIRFDPANQGIDDDGVFNVNEWFIYQCNTPNVNTSTFDDQNTDGIRENNISITAKSVIDDEEVSSDDFSNVTINTDPTSDIAITKTSNPLYIGAGDGKVNLGQTLEYQIVVTNTGNTTLTNIEVSDDLHPLVDFASNRNDSSIQVQTDQHGNEQVFIAIKSLAPGEKSIKHFDVKLHDNAPVETEFCNTAQVVQGNQTAESQKICHTVVDNSDGANIEVIKSSDPEFGPVTIGQSIEFTFEVTNTSGETARDVVVLDSLEDHLQFNANLTTDSGIDMKTIDGVERVTLDFGKIAAGEKAQKSFFVDVIAVPTNENVTCNRGQGYIDEDHENSSNLLCLDIEDPENPSLQIIKIDANTSDRDNTIGSNLNPGDAEFNTGDNDSQTINSGDETVFKIFVTNNSAGDLVEVSTTDDEALNCSLSANNVRYILTDGAEGTENTNISLAQTLGSTDNDNIFEPGESFSYECNKPNTTNADFADGDNDITVTGQGLTGRMYTDTDSSLIKMSGGPGDDPDLEILKSADLPEGKIGANEKITYTLTVKNNTSKNIENVVITDKLDTTKFDTNSIEEMDMSFDGVDTLTAYIGTLRADGETELQFAVYPKTKNISFCNIATVTGDGGLTDESNSVCHNTKDGGGGGGGGSTHNQMISRCVLGGSSNWMCQEMIINDDTPGIETYFTCMGVSDMQEAKSKASLNSTLDATCKDQFMTTVGMKGCSASDAVGSGTDRWNTHCDTTVVPPTANICTNLDVTTEKLVSGGNGFASEATVANLSEAKFEVSATIDVTTSDSNHRITHVHNAKIKMYDVPVPADSGALIWDSGAAGWAPDSGGTRSKTYTLNSTEINDLNTYKTFTSPGVPYTLDPYLDETASEALHLKNIAFSVATIRYDYIDIVTGIPDTTTKHCIDPTSASTLRDLIAMSDGSEATVNIIRPRARAVGSNISRGTSGANAFGYENTYTNVDSELENLTLDRAPIIAINKPNTISLAGASFNASGNNQVLEIDGDITLDSSLASALNSEFGYNPITIFVKNGNITIPGDFAPNAAHGFVLEAGRSVLVKDAVSNINGYFVSDEINSDGNFVDNQLNITGKLIGDVRDLLKHRVFIGNCPDENVDPYCTDRTLAGIQPAIIAEDPNTMPEAFKNFLAESWGQ